MFPFLTVSLSCRSHAASQEDFICVLQHSCMLAGNIRAVTFGTVPVCLNLTIASHAIFGGAAAHEELHVSVLLK